MNRAILTINDVANAVRGRRAELRLSQEDLAKRARVSRKWVNEFEAGKPTAELRLVLATLEALSLRLVLDDAEAAPGSAAPDLDALLDEYRRST